MQDHRGQDDAGGHLQNGQAGVAEAFAETTTDEQKEHQVDGK